MNKLIFILLLLISNILQAATLVVPNAPGGATDFEARLLSDAASKYGFKINLEYKPGADGIIGTNYVANKKGDKNTLLLGSNGPLVFALKLRLDTVSYDPINSFIPVIETVNIYSAIITSHSSPISNLNQLSHGQYTYGSLNAIGLASYEKLFNLIGNKGTIINYKSAGPMLIDIAANRINLGMGNLATINALVKSEKIKMLALTSPHRIKGFLEIPTVSEIFPGYVVISWHGIFLPKEVDNKDVMVYNKLFNDILNMNDVKIPLQEQFYYVKGGSSENLKNLLIKELNSNE
jgi:tripartite-type tricarboxylate transporter receptor subunit TctC